MVKVYDDVMKQEFYIDGLLKENLDVIKPYVLKDWDMLLRFSIAPKREPGGVTREEILGKTGG